MMRFKKRTYNVTKEGVDVTESVEEIDTPQVRRMKTMAEKRPGEIVVGFNLNKPSVEREDYLSDLSGPSQEETE